MATTKTQDKVLLALYERKDDAEAPSIKQIAQATGLSEATVRQTLQELEENGMVQGPPNLLNEAMQALKDMDENLAPTDSGYAEHIILIASLIAKADEPFLADRLGYDPEFVAMVGSRLRASGIWKGDHVSDYSREKWMGKDGGLLFFLDAAVATGSLMKPDDQHYQMTPGGLHSVAALIKKRRR
jgi:Iron dependent repressor, N-terminal DNA binding domain